MPGKSSLPGNWPLRLFSYFTISADNELTIYADVDDVDKYFEVMDSPATEEAMAFDGVLRDTVKVSVLDKEFSY